MLLDDIGDYLTSASVASSAALFRAFMPPEPNDVVVVYETPGMAAAHGFNANAGQAVAEYPHVQVVVRSTSYEAARVVAHRAWVKLDGLPTRTINGVQYHWAHALQSPFLMQRDEQARVYLACNYEVAKALSTTS